MGSTETLLTTLSVDPVVTTSTWSGKSSTTVPDPAGGELSPTPCFTTQSFSVLLSLSLSLSDPLSVSLALSVPLSLSVHL